MKVKDRAPLATIEYHSPRGLEEEKGQGVKDLFGDHGNAAERIADEIDAELRRRHV